jgi:hypothetical protein
MQKLTLVLALAALALAGWQYLEADGLRAEVERQRLELGSLTADLRGGVASEEAAREDAPTLLREPAATGPAGPVLDARAATPRALAKAVEDLRTELDRQREQVANLKDRVESAPAHGTTRTWKPSTVIHDAESATKVLDLDSGQKAELQRIVEDVGRQLSDVRGIPNDEGQTWKDVSTHVVNGGDGGAIAFSVPDFGAMQRWRKSRIPGSSETYGEAEARIKKDGKDRFQQILRPDQRKTFDDAQSGPLFGGGTESQAAIMITHFEPAGQVGTRDGK